MNYGIVTNVRDNEKLRESFNALTRKTFGFDFSRWYEAGHWGDMYIPYAMVDGGKVISNVSVNLMEFCVGGVKKNYIQLGTVMTDSDYQGQGLNRRIMEHILNEYEEKVDGIYLFGNDDVLTYYPKFGFKAAKEYEYYLSIVANDVAQGYAMDSVDLADFGRVYEIICTGKNANDGMYMNKNLGLYQFWLAGPYKNNVYYVPEVEAYVVAEVERNVVRVLQIFGEREVDFERLSKSFGEEITEMVLGFTPMKKEGFLVREYKEEDCTLFILGDDLECVEMEKLIFPALSHA